MRVRDVDQCVVASPQRRSGRCSNTVWNQKNMWKLYNYFFKKDLFLNKKTTFLQ